MIKTTNEYKKLMGETIRPPTYVRAEIQLVDSKVSRKATSEHYQVEPFSSDVLKGGYVSYITFEEDFYKMDGSQIILPRDSWKYLPCGVVTQMYAIESYVILSWEENQTFNGITIIFNNEFTTPMDITIQYKGKTAEAYYETYYYFTGNRLFVDKEVTTDVNKIIMTIGGLWESETTQIPKRIRIKEVVLGKVYDVQASDIITSRQDIEYDYLSTSLFKNEVVLNIYDGDKKFHPDNEDGYWSLLKEREKVKIYYGVGNSEILRNTLYITNYKRTKENELQITCNSLLSILTDTWEKGYFRPLHNVLGNVYEICEEYNLYFIDEITNNCATEIAMPPVSVAECLQLVANSCGATLYIDKDDNVVMTGREIVEENVKITFADMFEKPTVDVKTQLKEVRVSIYSLNTTLPSEEIYNSEWQTLEEGNTFKIEIPFENGVYPKYRLEKPEGSNVVLDYDNCWFGAYKVTVVLKGSGSFLLRILATDMPTTKRIKTYPVNDVGEICEIDNPFVMYDEDADHIAERVIDYYEKRKVYEMPVREDFSMETGDIVDFTNDLEQIHPGLVTRLQFNIPGQTGAMEVRRWD